MLIKIKVQPLSKKQDFVKKTEDSFEIKVKEKPERGEANKKVKELLSKHFNVPLGKVVLRKGAKQKNKIFDIKL